MALVPPLIEDLITFKGSTIFPNDPFEDHFPTPFFFFFDK